MTDPTPTQRMAKGYGDQQAKRHLAEPGDTLGATNERTLSSLAALHDEDDPNVAAVQRAKEVGASVPASVRMAAGYAANYAEAARRTADNA